MKDYKPALLEVSNIQKLSDLLKISPEGSASYKDIRETDGIYAFWLQNKDDFAEKLNRKLVLVGPKQKQTSQEDDSKQEKIKIVWDWNLKEEWILLYVGKTTNLKKRIGQHLKLGTKDWYGHKANKKDDDDNTLLKITTSCQFRAGIEHLLKKSEEINFFELIKDRVGLTIIEECCVIERFYEEDLAIGIGRPWFNVDSER